jgi:MFS family permease
VGGILTHQLGWRSIFLLNAGLGLVVALTAWVGIRSEWRVAPGQRFDHPGAWLYGASLGALIGGISALETAPSARWVAAAGAVGLAGFVAVELKVRQPLLDLRLFRSTVFAFSNLAALIHYSATFAVTFLLSLYLQTVAGLDPQRAGLVLLCQPVLMALLSPVAGRLSDRVEPRLVASAGMLVSLGGLLPLLFLTSDTSLVLVAASLVVLGTGFGLFSSPNTNAVMSAVPRQHYGVGSATLSTMRVVGQALSMALVAVILGHHMGQRALGPDAVPALLASTRAAFALFSALCVVGLFASLARGRLREGP